MPEERAPGEPPEDYVSRVARDKSRAGLALVSAMPGALVLGADTEVRLRMHAPPALWVRAPSLGDGWLKVPLYPHPLRGQKIWNVLGWFLAIGLLSTASAWIFVTSTSSPLRYSSSQMIDSMSRWLVGSSSK